MDQLNQWTTMEQFLLAMEQLILRRFIGMVKRKLISAVKAGDTESVEDLLDRGVPIDTKGEMGMSLLHLAAEGGHVTTMRLLIRRGCDVDSVDSGREFTPLHCAAAMGETKAVRELINSGASKTVVSGRYEIPQAALKGDKKTAEAMLEQGHPLHVVFSAYQGSPLYFGTALDQAALNGHLETAVAMLEVGCPLEVVNSDGATVLHFAAEGGNVDLVRELVSRGCNVNAARANGYTPLHCAACRDRTEAVRELIKLGAAKSVVAGNSGTPLHQAAIKGHVETAVAMLKEGCPLDVVSGAGDTVLHFAAEGGNVDLVRELVVRGCDVNAVEANGCTPLHSAAGSGRTEAVRELIKLGAAKSVVGGNGGTPLHQAAIKGHVETAVAMLKEGCPLDVVSGAGDTVLHFAAEGGNVDLVRELVVRGCDVNAVKANGCTPLHSAAIRGRTEAVRELIKLGAAKSVVGGNGGTPLHQAAIKGHVETAVAMLKEGCPLNVVSGTGATVLHFAAAGGNVDLVRELVIRGCDVNAVKANGYTPLHDAAGFGRTEAVRELIKLGATRSVVAGDYGTPLHQAAICGHVETAVAMLEEGCTLDVVNSVRATVLHFAAKGGNVDLVRELVSRGCDVNAVKANGYTPLHDAAGHGRTEAVRELIKLGAIKSVVAGGYGTPLHQAIVHGNVETVEALLEDELSEPDMVSHDVAPLMVQVLDRGIIGTCDSLGRTPVMWALRCGQVDVLKLLLSKGGSIRSDRDQRSLCAFEHCFISGQASNLRQFCEASGIRSSGEGLRDVLTTLITQGLAEAHKVLCLCAVSGDSVFLDDTFIDLVASDPCAMPEAVNCVKYCFWSGASFIDQLKIPGEIPLNPLQMALLSLKCFEMGFAVMSVKSGIKDHTSFITKLLSHSVLKETVHENFPNGLSPLDLAHQFELHDIAALIEEEGGRPGVWADIPQDVFVSCRSELFAMYPLLKKVFDPSQGGHEAVKKAVMKFLGAQTVERSQPGLWHPSAMTIGADVGAKTDQHEYKSLSLIHSVDDVLNLIVRSNIDINAMLNHSEGGRIHFGISSSGRVEVGLDFEQNEVIAMLREKVGLMLRKVVGSKIESFWPEVESFFVQVEPVDLQNDKKELTGRWRFDIVVKPHPRVVQLAPKETGYYRHGATSVRMTYGEFVRKIRAEPRCQRGTTGATGVAGSVSSWDADTAATVGANVDAERDDHEYKSLMGPVGGGGQPASNVHGVVSRVGGAECRRAINAMLNYPTGGCIHYGIYDNGIVQEGLDFEQNQAIDELRKKVGDVLRDFWPPVESPYVQVVPVNLRNVEHKLTGRWRFDIVVRPHPTVVLLSKDKPAYCRWGPQCQKMVHHVLAGKVRCEPAGQLPHGY